jgi:hypothetical protein
MLNSNLELPSENLALIQLERASFWVEHSLRFPPYSNGSSPFWKKSISLEDEASNGLSPKLQINMDREVSSKTKMELGWGWCQRSMSVVALQR